MFYNGSAFPVDFCEHNLHVIRLTFLKHLHLLQSFLKIPFSGRKQFFINFPAFWFTDCFFYFVFKIFFEILYEVLRVENLVPIRLINHILIHVFDMLHVVMYRFLSSLPVIERRHIHLKFFRNKALCGRQLNWYYRLPGA